MTRTRRPFLELRDTSFRLGESLVFANTCWIWEQDEQWGLVGPNGSGKSLFADALRGHLPIVGGEIRYGFRNGHGLTPEDSIAYIAFDQRKREVRDTQGLPAPRGSSM